jgi:gliding motility-associated-like protein
MKKILALIVFLFSFSAVAWAQPSFYFGSASPCTNQTACIKVTFEDLTDITSVKLPIKFDPAILEFTGVQGFNSNMNGLNVGSFDLSRTKEGIILLNWVGFECTSNGNKVTRPDGETFFEICFKAKGSFTESSTVGLITNLIVQDTLLKDPEPIIIKRQGSCSQNIGFDRTNLGIIAICVKPLRLFVNNQTANPGDLVCMDVKAAGFEKMTSLQFSMTWDSTLLKFENIIPLENLPNLSLGSFGTPKDRNFKANELTVSWLFVNPSNQGTTLKDSLTLFQVCYRVIGKCEQTSPVEITSKPVRVEATNIDIAGVINEKKTIPVILTKGTFTSGSCTPTGLQLTADCGPNVKLNDNVCVKVKTNGGFTTIQDLSYVLSFNPNILKFDKINNINPDLTGLGLTASSFDVTNTSGGFVGLDWRSPTPTSSATIADGTVLYEVCFKVVGLGGNSPIRFDRNTAVVRKRGSSENIGIFPRNCPVVVDQPKGITLELSGSSKAKGDTVCLSMKVGNFIDVTSTEFSLFWDPKDFKFREIKEIILPGATIGNFNLAPVASGTIEFKWSRALGVTLLNSTSIFKLCMEIIGDPPGVRGEKQYCNLVEITDFPIERSAITSTSNGQNIGIISTSSELCILNPVGFFLDIGKVSGFKKDTVCVPFRVREFKDITQAQFNITWNRDSLVFVKVIPAPALTLDLTKNFNTTSAKVGILGFDWQNVAGQTLTDSTKIFDVCYAILGRPNSICNPIEVKSAPSPSVTTKAGAGSVFPVPGEICIKDRLIITDKIITQVSCPGETNGSIELKVSGGTGNIFYNWRSKPVQFRNKVINLSAGKVVVEIFDNSKPPLILIDSFIVPQNTMVPIVNAGPDKIIGCSPAIALLQGSGSPATDHTYLWTTVTGQLPGDVDKLVAVVNRPGIYILNVTNKNTGCVAKDTVIVRAAPLPVANAGVDRFFNCDGAQAALDGSGSTKGDTIAYKWTALDNGLIVPGQETKISPQILAPGYYAFEVTNTSTSCKSTDSVRINRPPNLPKVSAGADVELSCTAKPITLNGSYSPVSTPAILEWFAPGNVSLGRVSTVSVSKLGVYILKLTDEATKCVTADTLIVKPGSDYPKVDAGADTKISCKTSNPVLQALVTNATRFQTFWNSPNGGTLQRGSDTTAKAIVTAPGTFVVTATNRENNCSVTDTVVVKDVRIIPTGSAGRGGTITCQTPSLVLKATTNVSFKTRSVLWTLNGNTVAKDTLQATATAGGKYFFTATDTTNGCFIRDSVVVIQAADLPVIKVDSTQKVTCKAKQLTLKGSVTPVGTNYSYVWSVNGTKGRIVSGGNTLTPIVNGVGTYKIRVTNNTTGCVGERDQIIPGDTIAPLANAGTDQVIDCRSDTVTLSSIGSATGNKIAYLWKSLGGIPAPAPASAAKVKVTKVGTYILTVRDTINGCTMIDTVKVSENRKLPDAVVKLPNPITCQNNKVTLDGSTSTNGAIYKATWRGITGQTTTPTSNSLIVDVTAGGQYELKVENTQNGCIDTAQVRVVDSRQNPTVKVTSPVTVPCAGAKVLLSGAGSATGAGFTYKWAVGNGTGTIANDNTLSPEVNAPGSYNLLITNTANNCTSTATVVVQLDNSLAPARAGRDTTTCTDEGSISANLPLGTTGKWISAGSARIETDTERSTIVTSLKAGDNKFFWSLSAPSCPNYSKDTIIIRREENPLAADDLLTLNVGQTEGSINIVRNDQRLGKTGYEIKVISRPKIGKLDSLVNGVATYRIARGVFGDDQFTYVICSKTCRDLCDTAVVNIKIPADPDYRPLTPNAITPNGDGKNDQLRFEQLDLTPEKYAKNEFIIFNRWGDIVYEVRPYLNDWKGTNQSGEDLPTGTYYYILRLDIPNGVIVRGNVTIMR